MGRDDRRVPLGFVEGDAAQRGEEEGVTRHLKAELPNRLQRDGSQAGHGTGAQLWGLIMASPFPPVAGPHDVKVVWRMTGSGPLKLAAYDGVLDRRSSGK